MAERPPVSGNSPVWRILGMVEGMRRSGSGWVARCPAHDDRHASLSIGEGDDGRALLNCKARCSAEQVCGALGLTLADLFIPNERRFRLAQNGHVFYHVRRDTPGGEKEMHWEDARGRKSLNGTSLSDLPLYGLSCLQDAPEGATVYLVEGESSAQALIDQGLYAVGTVTGASGTPNAAQLAPLLRYSVVLWPDNDDPGREHMERIAVMLNMKRPPLWLDWPAAPPKGDAVDFFKGGGTVDGLAGLVREWKPGETDQVDQITIRIVNAVDLLRAEFKPPRWAVPDLLMEGLALLAGRPKLGKSWLGLGLAADVSSGSLALGKIKTIPGEVLYLALEDGERRMQERLQLVLGDREPSPLLSFAYDWPKFDEKDGGLELLEQWVISHPLARLVVIDTFKRVRPSERGNNRRLYDLDYDALAPLAALARRHGIAIVVVFHARKGEADDPLDLVSGTTGLSGACDAVFVLRRERGQADASLFVTGRDIEERDMALKWHGNTADRFWWEWIGEAEDFRLSNERRQIQEVIEQMPGCKPAEIAGALGKTAGAIRYLLFKMVRESQVRARGSLYYPANAANETNTASSPAIPTPSANTQPRVSAVSTDSAITTNSGVSGGIRHCEDCGTELRRHERQRCAPCQARWRQPASDVPDLEF